mgnify:CR=1 FL=1
MTDRDELREKVAKALRDAMFTGSTAPLGDGWYRYADAVLAVLPTWEQVGWMSLAGTVHDEWYANSDVPVYIKRETEG